MDRENIKKEVVLDESSARAISNYINGAIFGNVMGDIKEAWKPGSVKKEKEENLDIDFSKMEQAMRPALPPENLPIQKGPDPYREPPE